MCRSKHFLLRMLWCATGPRSRASQGIVCAWLKGRLPCLQWPWLRWSKQDMIRTIQLSSSKWFPGWHMLWWKWTPIELVARTFLKHSTWWVVADFLAKDQNFGWQTWLKKTPFFMPCLLPNGKYVCTQRWSLLSAKAWWHWWLIALSKFKIPSSSRFQVPSFDWFSLRPGKGPLPGHWRPRFLQVFHGQFGREALGRPCRKFAF